MSSEQHSNSGTTVTSLSDIAAPISTDIAAFRRYFKQELRTGTVLLDAALRHLLKKKGKQVRPILVYLSADAAGGISERTQVGAALIELLHTATLVHDDVVDEADERRSLPSINSLWNNKTAVLVGDYLLAQGLRIANRHDEFAFLDITSRAVQRMSRGELLQTRKTRKLDIGKDEYFRIIADKTASLIAACCEIGGLSSGDNRDTARSLRDFGENLGMAFQIRDDLFDFLPEAGSTGKPVGNDLQEKKLTLPLIHALGEAPRAQSRRIVKMVRSGQAAEPEGFEEVIDFTRHFGGVAAAIHTATDFRQNAVNALDGLGPSPAKDRLVLLADFVVSRLQ